MHLSKQQSQKFYRLYNALMNAATFVLDVNDELFDPETLEMDNEEVLELSNRLWQNRSILDDFIQGNPYGFNDDELEIVASWKHALEGVFILYRHAEGYSFFIKDEYVFKAVGITQDIDELIFDTPTLVRTALLPFEDSITFAVNMASSSISLGENISESIDELYERALKNGDIISTPEAFIRASYEIREKEGLRAIDEIVDELEYYSASEEERSIEGFHRGALAGLTWQERNDAIDARMEKESINFKEYRLEYFERIALKDKAPKTLREALQKKTKAQISELIVEWETEGVSQLDKDELISLVIEVTNDTMEEHLLECQPNVFDTIRLLVNAGGVLTFSVDDLRSFETKAWAREPYILVSKDADIFTLVLPEEILQAIVKYDLDEVEKRREQLHVVRTYASTYTDLAGIVGLQELFDIYHEAFPGGVTQDEFVKILYKDTLFDEADYALWFHDNEDHLIHFKLTEEYSLDSSDPLSEEKQREALQSYRCYLHERHQIIPLRKLNKEENTKDAFYVYDHGLRLPSTQAFLSFIDAHIPDGESDYFFAERVYEQLLDLIQLDYDTLEIFEFLSEAELVFDFHTSNEMLSLLTNFYNHMPQWANNGWSPAELLEKETGKRIFYHPDGSVMKVGRNDPCPCGSGKKYKKCCGAL